MAAINLPPDFLLEMEHLMETEEEYQAFLESYQKKRAYGLRRNPLRYDREEFERKMPFKLRPIPWTKEGYYYEPEEQPGKNPYHEAGDYYIQEPSAMAVVELLDPKPGEYICDLCAAPGGKSSQIAGRLMGQGLLVSNEYVPKRAQILAQNMERMGVPNCVILNEDTVKLSQRFPGFFDRVVIDAPCSGEGMFRKDETAIENWSLQNVDLCAKRQMEILENGAGMLKPGGILVYSTCTFSEKEDEQVIAEFLNNHPEFEADSSLPDVEMLDYGFSKGKIPGTVRLWPHKIDGEGHFVARMIKKGLLENGESSENETSECRNDKNGDRKTEKSQNEKSRINHSSQWKKDRKADRNADRKAGGKSDKKAAEQAFGSFCKETLTESYLSGMQEMGELVWSGEQLYIQPLRIPDLNGLKVERPGLHLGTAKKNRFEPSHTWAMTLRPEDVKQVVALSDPAAYLRGETVMCGEEKGWVLAVIHAEPLGWGKASGGMLKNHYPKGLRKDVS